MNLGVQLRVYRKSKGHSVKKVSELTGIPVDRIYKWEKGTRPSDAEDLLKIREYMNGKVESVPKSGGKLETAPIKDDAVGLHTATEQDYKDAFNKALAGHVTLQDHIEVLKQWRADAESKYQDSHSANMKLLDLLNSKLAEIEANLKTGQHQLKEQLHVVSADLTNQLDGISEGLAAVEKGKHASAPVPKSAKVSKSR